MAAPSSQGLWVLLVLLERLVTAGALHVLGRKLRINPDRISNICDDGAVDAAALGGYCCMRTRSFAVAHLRGRHQKTRIAVENLSLFGFIDCTLKGTRRVKYGHAVPWTSGV
jgi:hypothetical protein